jgi:hypothetical protein
MVDGLRFCIRLEDCTGHWQSLGMLPLDDEYEDEIEDESGERSDDDDDDDSGEWYLNVMKRSLNGGGEFPRLLDLQNGENGGFTDPSNVNDRGRVPVCFLA